MASLASLVEELQERTGALEEEVLSSTDALRRLEGELEYATSVSNDLQTIIKGLEERLIEARMKGKLCGEKCKELEEKLAAVPKSFEDKLSDMKRNLDEKNLFLRNKDKVIQQLQNAISKDGSTETLDIGKVLQDNEELSFQVAELRKVISNGTGTDDRKGAAHSSLAASLGRYDHRFQNIAWLVATRGGMVQALGNLNHILYDEGMSMKKARILMLELLRDYLTRIEKLHIGLPQDIITADPISREATEKELLRILVHSSLSLCPPGNSPSRSPRRSRSRSPSVGATKSPPRQGTATSPIAISPSASGVPLSPIRTVHYTRPLQLAHRQEVAAAAIASPTMERYTKEEPAFNRFQAHQEPSYAPRLRDVFE